MSIYTKQYVKEEFPKFFDEITTVLSNDLRKYISYEKLIKRLEYMILETILGGKMIRGMICVNTILEFKPEITQQEFHDACILGWIIEFIEGFFLVADDIMDKSLTRRNKQCWYLRENNSEMALNDSFLIESMVYFLVDYYFGNHKNYNQLIKLIHRMNIITCYGQSIDLLISSPYTRDYNEYTVEHYLELIHLKTSYYTFALPVSLGYIYCDAFTENIMKSIEDVSILMGEYFQIQDDYLDCFGDYKVLGKVGTDIEDAKLCWVFSNAIKICNDEDRNYLLNNYGIKDENIVKNIKAIYNKYNLSDLYHNVENDLIE